MRKVMVGGNERYEGGIEAAVAAGSETLKSFLAFCQRTKQEPSLWTLMQSANFERQLEAGCFLDELISSAITTGYAFAVWEMDQKAREAKESPGLLFAGADTKGDKR